MFNNTLSDLSLKELKSICNDFSIPGYGTKKIISDRIQKKLLYETFTFLKLDNEIAIKDYRFSPIFEKMKTEKDFYEHRCLDEIRKLLSENSVSIDVGARSGNSTIYFLKICDFQKSFVFEPKKSSTQLIRENARLNNVEEKIVINEKGVSAISSKSSGTFWHAQSSNISADKPSCARVSSLDDIFSAMSEKISVIKIAAGVLERQVLIGARGIIEKHRPIIVVGQQQNGPQLSLLEEAECRQASASTSSVHGQDRVRNLLSDLIEEYQYELCFAYKESQDTCTHIFAPKIVNL
jgi:FkbM family methyltransferase